MTGPGDLEPLSLDGIVATDLGAEVTGPFRRGQVLAELSRLFNREAATRWQVGDLLVALIDDDGGDMARTFRELAGLGYQQDWLSNSLAVAMKVAPAQRRRGLHWGHHEAVSHLDPADQDRWLGEALRVGLTVPQLQAEIKHETQGRLDTGDDSPAAVVRIVSPKPAAVRAVLAVDPDAWVLWQPCSGDMRRADQ